MSILSFIKSLLPSMSKSSIIDDARTTYTELESITIPSYAEAEKIFGNWKFKSKNLVDKAAVFKRINEADKDKNMVVAISKALARLASNKTSMMDKLDKNFESEVMGNGMSSVKSNLLRIVEVTTFINEYALLFLNYVYILETAEVNDDNSYVKSSLTPVEIEKINTKFTDFCLAINILGRDKEKINKAIDNIPDVLLDINTGEVVTGTFSEAKLDPLNLHNFSSNTNNVIYHVRLVILQRQHVRYKRNVELKKVLELRLLNLQMQMEKTPDASLEKQINYTQERIEGLTYEIDKMEEGA